MARAKNTSRAEARRRTKESARADLAEEQSADGDDATSAASTSSTSTSAPRARTSIFKMPNVRADINGLPAMFRSRRLLWLPFALILIGLGLALILPVIPTDLQQWAYLYIQYFFFPQALFTYFIGGFVATRASYLVGFLLGLATGLGWVVVLLVGQAAGAGLEGTATTDVVGASVYVLTTSMFLGTVAGGFAGWYRDFLRGMQDKGKQRRADQEAAERAKRRDGRQESRRAAKKPTG